ncbi:MAG TPA: DUF1259 domain-containing protein [Nitrospira sp.]|nr:DUF1259 domain-containing protein [Nitrospira sp.]
MKTIFGIALLVLASVPALAENANTEWKAVESILGREGVIQEGVLKVLFPRADLEIRMKGSRVQADFALSSWLGFKKVGSQTMLMGDFVLLDEEVAPVLEKLVASGLEVSALHNHFVGESPTLKFMHFMGHGRAIELAKKMRTLLQATGTPLDAPPAVLVSEIPQWKVIESIFGLTGRRKGDLLLFSIPRRETIREHGVEIPAIMGMASAIHFQAAGRDVVSAGDLTLLPEEVNPVVSELIKNGVDVTAIHNHTIFEEPRLFSVHFWAQGKAEKVAKAVKKALSRTNSRL